MIKIVADIGVDHSEADIAEAIEHFVRFLKSQRNTYGCGKKRLDISGNTIAKVFTVKMTADKVHFS